MQHESCERCGRLVVAASTDFGNMIWEPTSHGIVIKVRMGPQWVRLPGTLSKDEIRDFLRRAYGDDSRCDRAPSSAGDVRA